MHSQAKKYAEETNPRQGSQYKEQDSNSNTTGKEVIS